MRNTYLILLSVFFIRLYAQDTYEKKIETLKGKVLDVSYTHPDSAYQFSREGLDLAKARKDSSSMAFFYQSLGVALSKAEMAVSSDYIYKAYKIFSSLKNVEGILASSLSLATAYGINLDKRISYLQEALPLIHDVNIIEFSIVFYNSFGTAFMKEGCYDSAMFYFEKSLELSQNNSFDEGIASSYTNIGHVAGYLHHFDIAITIYKKAQTFIPSNMTEILPYNQLGLLRSYLYMDQLDSALHYFYLIQDNFSNNLPLARDAYKFLANYYTRTRDFERANTFLLKTDSVEDKIESRSRKNHLSILELEYESQLKEEKLGKLQAEMDKAQNTRVFLIISLILVLIISFILFRLQRQKAHLAFQNKQRAEAENKLITAELENSELKRQYLDDELKYTNKELISYASTMAQNNTFINDLRKKIGDIGRLKDMNHMQKELEELKITLLQAFHSDEEREAFIEKSRHLNSSLVFYLKTHYSQLSESDINFLILLMLKFDSKEIAALNNIELGSARKRRHRIRKKLGMEVEDTFEDFFKKILEEAGLRAIGGKSLDL